MSPKDSFKKNLLFLATAEIDLVAEVIAHVKFLDRQSRIYVLAPENLCANFKKLRNNVDVVLDIGKDEPLAFSDKKKTESSSRDWVPLTSTTSTFPQHLTREIPSTTEELYSFRPA